MRGATETKHRGLCFVQGVSLWEGQDHGSAGASPSQSENTKPLTPALSPAYRGEGVMAQPPGGI